MQDTVAVKLWTKDVLQALTNNTRGRRGVGSSWKQLDDDLISRPDCTMKSIFKNLCLAMKSQACNYGEEDLMRSGL